MNSHLNIIKRMMLYIETKLFYKKHYWNELKAFKILAYVMLKIDENVE